ncbi:MAG: TonB-dependent receptor, partial [Bacteroidota bacterium]
MHKLILSALAICFLSLNAMAQPKLLKDTASVKDTIVEEFQEGVLDNIPVVSVDDNDASDVSSQNVASVLTAGRDPFFAAAAFNWSPARFRMRGYDGEMFTTFINGVPMENLDNGFTPFGLWGGLNDVMRNRDITMGLRPSSFTFGDIGSNTNIDVRASKQRKQTSFSYAISNRNYRHRAMLTHSTGLNKKGWAFSLSGSIRYADEGYAPGTYFDGQSYFLAVDKLIGQKHLLSFAVMGAPTETGRQGPSVKEMQDLAGTNYYNPFWGYQNGKKRNASVARTHQPYFLLSHEYRINNTTRLNTGVSYSTGERGVTALDWYNSADPRPDYYRYLPSYYQKEDPLQAAAMADAMRNDINLRQINWDEFYLANQVNIETIQNVNGIAGNNVTGKRSRYVLQERVINTDRLNFNTVLNTQLKGGHNLTGGFSYQQQKNHYFQRIDDLLGGEFFVDLNQFAERNFPNNPNVNQNNIDQPNRIVRKGDQYGYDYNIYINRAATWLQGDFKTERVDFFFAAEASYTRFWREGNVRNGLFPNNSFGNSKKNNFINSAFKAGVTYKINGRNYLYVNAAYLTKPPFFENVYISPRNRDFQQENINSVIVNTYEAGYILNAPKIKFRANLYSTTTRGDYNVMTFFHDDYRNFVNYALSNIDRVHYGAELGFEARL